MKTLNPNWFAEGLIDTEYKKYILLAYLQEIEMEYKAAKLFPALNNVHEHIKCMKEFKDQCESLSAFFPKELTGIDSESGHLTYSSQVENPELLKIMNEIIEFSLPHLHEKLEQGKEIFNSVQNMIEIEPIGILPVYKDEGYFLLNCQEPETEIYAFRISQLQDDNRCRILETKLLKKVKNSFSNTYYHIKEKLIKEFKELPNPATYLIQSQLKFPKESTLLPVAKRLFLSQSF